VSLVNCPHCRKPISAGALSCPHCGADPKAPLEEVRLPCRVCGALLRPSVHRVPGTYGVTGTRPTTVTVVGGTATVSGGGTYYERVVHVWHAPCPQCGEPKPLRRLIDIAIFDGLWKLGFTLVFPLFVLCGLALIIMHFLGTDLLFGIRILPFFAVWLAVSAAMLHGWLLPYGKRTRHVG